MKIWLPPIASDITSMELVSKSVSLEIFYISPKSLSPFQLPWSKNSAALFHFLFSHLTHFMLWMCLCLCRALLNMLLTPASHKHFVFSLYLDIFHGANFLSNKVKIFYIVIHWSTYHLLIEYADYIHSMHAQSLPDSYLPKKWLFHNFLDN